jgi:hypothetical protein
MKETRKEGKEYEWKNINIRVMEKEERKCWLCYFSY